MNTFQTSKLSKSLLTGVAALVLAATSNAALILGTTIESVTAGLNPQMAPEKAINGFGLEGDVPALTGNHRQSFDTNW